MAFEHLKLFRDIAQTRSMSRGAELNRISQSAATQHIQELERRFEVVFLDRATRPLSVTPAGERYLEFCRDVLRRKEILDSEIQALKEIVSGEVRVASIYSVGLSEMSRIEDEFSARYPQARLAVEYLRPEKIYEAILADRADIGLVSYPETAKEITSIPWLSEKMVVAMEPRHPLAQRKSIRAHELNGVDFVGFDVGLPIRREIDRYLREQGVGIRLVMHFEVIQMIKEALEIGSGVGILPARILRSEVEQGRLVTVPLEPVLYRPVGIIHRKRKRFSRAAEMFLALLRQSPVEERAVTAGTTLRGRSRG
ncbi:MAG: LysR family transcriptional regulator [Bryobacterales bacterium]|nr:LysR family transcriptional regulator [Bryobacterales bacterium]